MRPDLTLLIASSMSALFACCSSMAMTAPWMMPPTFGSVLKKTMPLEGGLGLVRVL
jgi:hypothetical protein